jgi:CRP/FNR family cyclic AMP-dependent transcriptional regulator
MATTIAVTKESLTTVVSHHLEPVFRLLSSARVFRSLRGSEIEQLASAGWSYRASRGQILYCEGEQLRYLYLIESGSVKLIRNSEEGKELIVGLAGPSECFGPLALSHPSGCLAQALEDSALFLIPLPSVRRVAAGSPALALDLLEICEKQSMDAQTTAARLAFDTVPQRLAHLLLGISDPRYGILRYPLNQTEIANMIGSSRETVCSVLSRMRREGCLSIVKGRIRVLERERLAAIR